MSANRAGQERAAPPKVLFFGMTGAFSLSPLNALLERNIDVCAVILPAPSACPGVQRPPIRQRLQTRADRFALPRAGNSPYSSIADLAWARHLPVWEVSALAYPETIATLAAYQADCICVACFSRRIPRVILDLPRLGCLNVHPSLLPANRGPAPLFWTFREGSVTTGVTVHMMDEGLDTGPIVMQQALTVPDGIGYTDLEQRCAVLGGALLAESVWQLYTGCAVMTPQDESQSSYHAQPTSEDFILRPQQLRARHVYNFIRGVRQWGEAIMLQLDERHYIVYHAISYSQWNKELHASDRDAVTMQKGNAAQWQALLQRDNLIEDESGCVYICCLDGWVKVDGTWDAKDAN